MFVTSQYYCHFHYYSLAIISMVLHWFVLWYYTDLCKYIIEIMLFSLVGVLSNACETYTNLTEWQRSVAYENDEYEHVDLCDRNLQFGWYRAATPAGGDMPTIAPGFSRCGTTYPIWLNGR